MRKVIIGFTAVLLSAFVIVMVSNAQNGPQEVKKCTTEASKDCSKGPNASACCKMKYGSTAETKVCDKVKDEAKACDKANCKEGKCSHETCKNATANASCAAKKCEDGQPKSGSQN